VKACIPVAKDHGMKSVVFPHFGSAPCFLVVDTETRALTAHPNPAASQRGRCHALDALGDERVDLAVVGNIGGGAMDRFRAAGVAVYRTGTATVGEVVGALAAGALPRISQGTCKDGLHDPRDGGCGSGRAHCHESSCGCGRH
jgi:predicted Fe-Mo cluster-binding NifX family protein